MNGQNKLLMLTFELLFVFFTGSIVDTQSPATELSPVEVPHGTECSLLVLIFTKAISLGLSRFPVVHQSRATEFRLLLPLRETVLGSRSHNTAV